MSAGRDEMILQFVMDNPDCTKTSVINYINPGSPVPTHRAIKRLIEEKRLVSTKDKFNSSMHHLRINEKNKFNMIIQLLSRMHVMLEKINKQKSEKKKTHKWITNYSPRFRQVCDDALYSLLINTDKIIPEESECHILYIKIIKALKELETTFYQSSKDHQKKRKYTIVDTVRRERLAFPIDGTYPVTSVSTRDIETVTGGLSAIFDINRG